MPGRDEPSRKSRRRGGNPEGEDAWRERESRGRDSRGDWTIRFLLTYLLSIACVFSPIVLLLSAFPARASQDGGEPASVAGQEQRIRDCLGHEVVWKEPPHRIISLSPNLTEILAAIGAADALVGVTRFCDYPPYIQSIPRVGGILDPNLEAMSQLEPDLVLTTRGVPLETMATISDLGLPLYALDSRGGLEVIRDNILEIGVVTGWAIEAAQLADSLWTILDNVHQTTSGLASEQRPRVYYGELGGAHWTTGPGTFIHDLIWAAGGRNVTADAPSGWIPVSLEALVQSDPQVYLGTYDEERETPDQARERVHRELQTLPGWRDTSLGQQATPRVWLVEVDQLQRPGPRIIPVTVAFSKFLHPDLWSDTPADGKRIKGLAR